MRRQIAGAMAAAVLLATSHGGTVGRAQEAWAVSADVAESCSCEVSCPCNFGQPTTSQCNGNRLIAIDKGHYGGVDLSGVSFVVTFEMGRWSKIYVDERISTERLAALERLLPAAFGGFHRNMRSLQRAPMSVSRTADTVHFSVPASTVEMQRLRGLNGQPIVIEGLPSPVFMHYTQYRSTAHTHEGGDTRFSQTGTNGFTSRMEVSSAP